MTAAKKPNPPRGLGPSGRALWRSVFAAGYALRPDEVRVLAEACRSLDLVSRLASELPKGKLIVGGSRGQPRPHPLLDQLRAERLAFARLARQLGLPDDVVSHRTAGATSVTVGARELARQRWGRA